MDHHGHNTENTGCSGCFCGHDHSHSHCAERKDLRELLLGAGAFAVGFVLEGLQLPGWIAFTAAYLVLGLGILGTAAKNLAKGHFLDENFLMSIATLGAFAIGEFPEAVGVMLFYRVGEYFEERAVARSRSQIMAAVDMRPETVTLTDTRVIPADQAQVGDLLLVRPGDRIPLDGVVVAGQSRIDTSPITGEPVPVSADPGDRVTSGCVNTSGQLTVRVEKPLSESMVTRILKAVENAAAGKPKIDRFITRFARIYTPAVVIGAVLTAVVPSLITGDWNYWVYTALSFLVMSCPCALVLSVPLAFFSGIGVAGKKGILFKGGLSMEALAAVKVVAVDKTGTVTAGDFRVQKWAGREDVLEICATCEQRSSHPIAVSIVSAAKEQGIEPEAPEELEELAGYGIRAVLKGKTVLCGNQKLMARFAVEVSPPKENGSVVLVAEDGVYIGYLVIADTLKPGVKEAFDRLKALGIFPVMLTGDIRKNAQEVAQAAGISRVYANLLPEEKLGKLQDLRSRFGATMFVGDGINDAPVLAGADVGAAMGSGADAAIEAADVVYMTSHVAAIPDSVQIARQTRRIAWQNVTVALLIKLAVVLLGLWGNASMWLAVFADSGVAMLCVLNSIRMLYGRKKSPIPAGKGCNKLRC